VGFGGVGIVVEDVCGFGGGGEIIQDAMIPFSSSRYEIPVFEIPVFEINMDSYFFSLTMPCPPTIF